MQTVATARRISGSERKLHLLDIPDIRYKSSSHFKTFPWKCFAVNEPQTSRLALFGITLEQRRTCHRSRSLTRPDLVTSALPVTLTSVVLPCNQRNISRSISHAARTEIVTFNHSSSFRLSSFSTLSTQSLVPTIHKTNHTSTMSKAFYYAAVLFYRTSILPDAERLPPPTLYQRLRCRSSTKN